MNRLSDAGSIPAWSIGKTLAFARVFLCAAIHPAVVNVTNVKREGTFKLTAGKKKGTATITVQSGSEKETCVVKVK